MFIDAIVLAGGRASRLGGTSKAALHLSVRSLLESTLAAVAAARQIVVVGDEADIRAAAPDATVTIVRETPAFGGPAAAIAAGFDTLHGSSEFVLVVGCDMPGVSDAIDVLVDEVRPGSDGAIAVSSDGRPQSLVGIYSTTRLGDCIDRYRVAGNLENLSVRALLSGLNCDLVPVPEGSTDDVDTWTDAARLGVLIPQPHPTKG